MDHCPNHSGIEAVLDEHGRRLDEGDKRMDRIVEKLDSAVSTLKGWLIGLLLTVLGSTIVIVIGVLITRAAK